MERGRTAEDGLRRRFADALDMNCRVVASASRLPNGGG
jgi:hypothetical protein